MAIDVVGSKMPAQNGYGQNGFPGPSSDNPGKDTKSGFLPACELPGAAQASIGAKDSVYPGGRSGKAAPRAASKGGTMQGPQTRDVSDKGYPPSFGMAERSARNK